MLMVLALAIIVNKADYKPVVSADISYKTTHETIEAVSWL